MSKIHEGEALLKQAAAERLRMLTPPQLTLAIDFLMSLGDVKELLPRVEVLSLPLRLQIIEALSAHSMMMTSQIELVEGMEQDEASRKRAIEHFQSERGSG